MGLFGNKRKIQELEKQLQLLKADFDSVTAQKDKAISEAREYKLRCEDIEQNLEIQLASARRELSQLYEQKKAVQTENQNYRQNAETLENEYLSLKNIYQQKIQDFEESVDNQTRQLVHEAESARLDLADEIQSERQKKYDELQEVLSSFNNEYKYYLQQVVLMTEALNTAAVNTCSMILSGNSSADVTERFAQEMHHALDDEGISTGEEEFNHSADSGILSESPFEEIAAQLEQIDQMSLESELDEHL